MMLGRNEAIRKINHLSAAEQPFFFFTDFLGERVWLRSLDEISAEELQFVFHSKKQAHPHVQLDLKKEMLSFEAFRSQFEYVQKEINIGNSFLVNLTTETPISLSHTLQQVYDMSSAKYKLRYKDEFVCFSPETFVQIREGAIYSYPMKGTIDASILNAEQLLMTDPKEIAEHVTITDLIRNDLSQVAVNVVVSKFRFISEIQGHDKKLLQVSSEIKGELPPDYKKELGTFIFRLLPAGSISGAPKSKTLAIIRQAENYQRGFYTGICGCFDGHNFDSGVMIRFIEKRNGKLYYKSGAGITSFSDAMKEYQELKAKIYVPLH